MTTPSHLVVAIAQVLERLGIPYHVGGSVASSRYGHPRTTADVDIVIDVDAERLEALAGALEADYYVSRDAMTEALKHHGTFNAIGIETPLKIDFFVLGTRPFDREEFSRAVRGALDPAMPQQVSFKSPEDLVLRKLEWFRLGGGVSERQWQDVLGILSSMHGRLDDAYLDRWAGELGLADLLARARREIAG